MPLSFARNMNSDKAVVSKCKNAQKRNSVRAGNSLSAQIEAMNHYAKEKLKSHEGDYVLIRNEQDLDAYVDAIIANGIGAIDTETTGLNPLLVDLVGVCLYTPNKPAAYIPINHKSYVTGVKTKEQLSEEAVYNALNKCLEVKWVLHNAKYDIRVLRATCGFDLEPYWDTMLASYCIDENESHRLKDLHLKYCDSKDEESLTFDKLFGGVTFDNVPITTAYLYAAGDAIKTFELYEYQKTILNRRCLPGPLNVFMNLEMPLIKVVCDMEDRGVCLDFDVCKNLSEKYNALKVEVEQTASRALKQYDEQVENYKLANQNHRLSEPISLTSPSQLAVLFYDILKLESPDKRKPRGTGEDILKHFASETKHSALCKAILEIRRLDKLIGTYIDKLPTVALEDGRIHANFNQYGAKTGRFSSSDPNLQNIPSHNKEIRQMFKAQDGYIFVGADYSQQEPMVTAHLSQDAKMIEAFTKGKDIYSTIASLAFNRSYEDCLEFRPDGSTNVEGKEYRGQAKIIVLGILYGRQIPALGEQLGCNANEAQKIYDAVLNAFKQLAQFIDYSQTSARQFGFVETAWGRRRHLPDIQLPKYQFKYAEGSCNFDPLAFGNPVDTKVPASIKNKWVKRLNKCRGFKERNNVLMQANKEGIVIKDNGGFISQAERQCVNARVQGSAADMVKLAMININNDEIMQRLDFHLVLQVHDEVIGECPEENVEEVKERLEYLMVNSPKHQIDLPFKCDIGTMKNWL